MIPHRVCQEALLLVVLICQRPEAMCVGEIHTATFGFEFVERRWAKALLATNLGRRHSGFLLLDQPDNLRLGQTAFFVTLRSFKVGQDPTSM